MADYTLAHNNVNYGHKISQHIVNVQIQYLSTR